MPADARSADRHGVYQPSLVRRQDTLAFAKAAAGSLRLDHERRVLNHKIRDVGRVTKIYARHPYGAEKRVALETWARRLDAILTSKDQPNVVPFAR